MRPTRRFWLWLVVLDAGVIGAIGALAVTLYGSIETDQRPTLIAMASEAAPPLVFAALVVLAACAGALHWAFRRYPHAVRQVADQTRVLLGANPEHRIATDGGAEVADLAAVLNQFADRHRQLGREVETRSAEARARVEEERDRFAALMSELSQGVLVTNVDGRILLYNEHATRLLAPASGARGGTAPLGLGRSVFALLEREQVAHALDMIQQQFERAVQRPSVRFVTTAGDGALLRVQVAPFLGGTSSVLAGMVFTLDDVGRLVDRESQRLKLLQALATDLRAPVANLRAAAESLESVPQMPPEQRARFVGIVAAESRVVTEHLNAALLDYADALKDSLTLEDMRVADLLTVLERRLLSAAALPAGAEAADTSLWVRVDSFAFVNAVLSVALRLRDEYDIRSLQLRANAGKKFAEIDLVWTGAIVSAETLAAWEMETIRVGAVESPLTLRDVLQRHGGEVWVQNDKPRQRSWLRFLLPLGEPLAATPPVRALESRPEYYDFDLFERIESAGALAERRLSELAYTVFDTETTGLEPSAGDEIISIGAVRIVNGRLLRQEVFEQLVNPRRPIHREATRIHGIDDRALAGQPTIEDVLPAFHRFCEDTVLVAHNAAFDMRFLELKEAATGIRFEQPVLDTLLLSAVVNPSLEEHNLDAIAERLGVRVIGRHTALGDALVTGEVFLRLLPLLADRGIKTLGQALDASRETFHARLQY
jgi:DNA polymerase-3 subunit epsilon